MLRSSNLIIAGVVVAFCVSTALATPVVDGTVAVNEYGVIVDDAAGETTEEFYNTGLDIETMQFDDDGGHTTGGSSYMAVTVVNPDFDTDGDDSSFLEETMVSVMFYSNDNGSDFSYYLEICVRGTNIEVDLMHYNGTNWTDVALIEDTDYDIAIGGALELRLSDIKFNTDNVSSFRAQLDGTGGDDDDQMDHNLIPEPATLALLGLGGIGILIRRRRK